MVWLLATIHGDHSPKQQGNWHLLLKIGPCHMKEKVYQLLYLPSLQIMVTTPSSPACHEVHSLLDARCKLLLHRI